MKFIAGWNPVLAFCLAAVVLAAIVGIIIYRKIDRDNAWIYTIYAIAIILVAFALMSPFGVYTLLS